MRIIKGKILFKCLFLTPSRHEKQTVFPKKCGQTEKNHLSSIIIHKYYLPLHPQKQVRRPDGGIGRRAGLKHQWGNPCRFDPGSGYLLKTVKVLSIDSTFAVFCYLFVSSFRTHHEWHRLQPASHQQATAAWGWRRAYPSHSAWG